MAALPTNPLSTCITGTVPIPVIGPAAVVPKPTLLISKYSSLTLKISLGLIEEIPESERYISSYVIPTQCRRKNFETGNSWSLFKKLIQSLNKSNKTFH